MGGEEAYFMSFTLLGLFLYREEVAAGKRKGGRGLSFALLGALCALFLLTVGTYCVRTW